MASLNLFRLTAIISVSVVSTLSFSRFSTAFAQETDDARGPASIPDPEHEFPTEVRLGMSAATVRDILGSPRFVRVAGQVEQGNQEWVYMDTHSARSPLGPGKIVYFEGGKVVGWKTVR